MEAVTAPQQVPTLDSPELFTNRELSWLQFNERVLELAEDESIPLLERVKFLAIYAANLDEFFMVRVAGLHDQVEAGIDARGPDGLSPSETIDRISERTRELGRRHSLHWEQPSRSFRCSLRSPWARDGRSRTSPTSPSRSPSGCATPCQARRPSRA